MFKWWPCVILIIYLIKNELFFYFFIFERGNKAISGENTRGPISPKIRKGESATFMREKTFQSNL